MITHESRSARALSHAERATLARSAARRYLSFSAGVQRTYSRSVAGSGIGGLPLGRLGLSIPELWAHRKDLTSPFLLDILCVH